MVRHVIIWQLKEEYTKEQKEEIRKGIKEGLEGLLGVIPGLKEIHVQLECFPTSNGDAMLDSLFESEEALNNYTVNPAHVAVATTKVRPFVKQRFVMDFEV